MISILTGILRFFHNGLLQQLVNSYSNELSLTMISYNNRAFFLIHDWVEIGYRLRFLLGMNDWGTVMISIFL